MDADFWHRKWASEDIGFHEKATNPLLLKHFAALALAPGERVFVPLCGKTLDIHWLLSRGHPVVAAELSRLAVEQLFDELGARPTVTACGATQHFGAPGLDVFVGDIFELSAAQLGSVAAVYDRAAMIALPPATRERYAAHLLEITAGAPQLVVCMEYDQTLMDGPPFSVAGEEIVRHYRDRYRISHADAVEIAGGFKGRIPATENVWLLQR